MSCSDSNARTLKELMGLLAALPATQIQAHLVRHDFSRWIADVFRDHPLGARIRALEGPIGGEEPPDVAADIAQAIRARYAVTLSASGPDTKRA